MKTLLITIAIVIVSSIYAYDSVPEVKTVHSQPTKMVEDIVKVAGVIGAIIQVESSGNDSAYNKSEDAVGCLQIRPIMVREVNRLLKIRGDSRRYTLLNRWNRQKSIEMFLVYNKNISSFEAKARRWNGGCRGMEKTATVKYWNKVKKELINNKKTKQNK